MSHLSPAAGNPVVYHGLSAGIPRDAGRL